MQGSQAPEIWFTALETFDARDEAWPDFVSFSHLIHLDDVISLDASLCPSAFETVSDDMWPHLVDNESFMFTDLDALKRSVPEGDMNILAVVKNPREPVESVCSTDFVFAGYDLVDREGENSALVNCGGFPAAFNPNELSSSGLIKSFARVQEIQSALAAAYPKERHADCNIWAIFVEKRGDR